MFTRSVKKDTFLPLHEQFLAFFEVRLHFLEVGFLVRGLDAVEGLCKFKIELVLVFVRFSFKLERFSKSQLLDLFHRQFCRSISLVRLI